ncbi:MAG: hypothetical protein KAR13_19500 [Desulfobulbaceae bacterium]|nr:hypothetical protein [Desulfobulbaceae bacterium]
MKKLISIDHPDSVFSGQMKRYKFAYRRRYTEAHANLLMVNNDGFVLYAQLYSTPGFRVRELGIYEATLGVKDSTLVSLWDIIDKHHLLLENSGKDPGPGQLSVEFDIEDEESHVSHVYHALQALPEAIADLETASQDVIGKVSEHPVRTLTPFFSCDMKKVGVGETMSIMVTFRNRGHSQTVIPNPRAFGDSSMGQFRARVYEHYQDIDHGEMWFHRTDINLSNIEFVINPRAVVPSDLAELQLPSGGSLSFSVSFQLPKCSPGRYKFCPDYVTFGDPVDEGKDLVVGYYLADGIFIDVIPDDGKGKGMG